ncbi:alpha-L-arabinofuranosidase [Anaerolinea thermolimosa]|uniref:alpha-N-arabinofuranosidase n=1 Tax=Anaerolinea thermolimosa TaxID=229919 RepID=UPI000783B993|nr:alpha-L-arabinofuranosidase C-terminal domain-containing protein [Anaerolinea thermolimosa]GAP06402.1 alpha-L-arabinofuranosidase [Anaerolinea thermolimosa]
MSTTRITINPTDTIATINPNIYGHFAEHLGRCIYDGIWVGEESPIPNIHGFRKDVIETLRRMKVPVIRWPGGCFADDYHWQDGIGPRSQRPRRINIHWGEVIETNQVGTIEFVQFCRLIGAEPYFCGNVGSGTPRELRDWIEYCNFPVSDLSGSTWAQQRAADGSPAPLDVTYWGVGNENWGCGGNFSPEDYCTEFRRFASFIRGFGKKLNVIACGPANNDVEWTDRFFRKLHKDYWPFNNIDGFAAHYYCGTAGTATQYTEEEWYRLLEKGLRMEELVVQQRAAMDAWDPTRKIGLIIDEWGTWHPVEEGTNPAFLYQQNTIRDAIVAANTLDIFNRHADKVVMANIAQMVNVLQAVILTEGENMLVTPTGYVYEMYAPHQGAQSLRLRVETPEIHFQKTKILQTSWQSALQKGEKMEGNIPAVSGSASIRENVLFISLTNSHVHEEAEIVVNLLGDARAERAQARVLSGEIHAHNTFDAPHQVVPQPMTVDVKNQQLHVVLPPASVVTITVVLSGF